MSRRNNVLVGLVGALGVASVGLGVNMTTAAAEQFEPAAWKAQAGNREADNPRSRMADAAQKSLRPGMSREEVEALLGAPDERFRKFLYGNPATKAVRFGVDGKVPQSENNIATDLSGAGMTQRQVAAVIGEPTEIRDDYIYKVGTRGFSPNPIYLHVEFSKDGALVRNFLEET